VEVTTPTILQTPTGEPSIVAPADVATFRARAGRASDEARIRWRVEPIGPYTGPAYVGPADGGLLTFRGESLVPKKGSRAPNPPLEYEVVASLKRSEVPLRLRQLERDVLRQEYVDFGTLFRPGASQVGPAAKITLNTGNYLLIAEEIPRALESLLGSLGVAVRDLMRSDVQSVPVGKDGLDPEQVVVEPGPPVLRVGRLGNTDPEGDDVCSGPLTRGRCNGAIRAGPNGIAETRANNRRVVIDLARAVTSGFRNPQRNRAVGSVALNSRHSRGRAFDLDPRVLSVPGRTAAQMMCVLEAAGDKVVGPQNSFTERGAATFLDCDSPAADHVHVQR
jgi:hypothetical protein